MPPTLAPQSYPYLFLISGSSEDEEAVVNKYKALLSEIKVKETKSKLDTDMEVSWIPSDAVNQQVGRMLLKALFSLNPNRDS